MKQHTSNFIFSLADKYQIPIQHSKPAEFSDESYFGFCTEYIEQCKNRDTHLKNHLLENPSIFRTFLPWRPNIFETVFQTQWYYDEIVIYDPIYFEINTFKTGNFEYDKTKLRNFLIFLNSLKDSINEGFLLFGSYDTFSSEGIQIGENKYEHLLELPDFRKECDKLVQVYKMTNGDGNAKSYYNIRSMYKDKSTLFTIYQDAEKIKTPQGFSIEYNFANSTHTLMSIEDIRQAGFYDKVYDSFKEDYPNEITEVLNYIDIGANIKTPVLFNRKLDELILSNISHPKSTTISKGNDYYKLLLPFVNGIPPARLFDVRAKMPNAFTDFRNLMFRTIDDFEKNGTDPEFLKLKIEESINPLLRKLEAEMKNSLTKVKIIGAGLPLVSGLGLLSLMYFGIDISKYLTLLFGGGLTVTELGILNGYLSERELGKSNSLYYLWSVKQ